MAARESAHFQGVSWALRGSQICRREVISILEDGFENAWPRVESSKAPYSGEEYAPAARAIVAKYIIEAAQAGERDHRRWQVRLNSGRQGHSESGPRVRRRHRHRAAYARTWPFRHRGRSGKSFGQA
jgi:hypothetical protein